MSRPACDSAILYASVVEEMAMSALAEARIRQYIPPQLKAALWYASAGIPVFPLHYPVREGACSCGDGECRLPGRHPLTRHGMHDATTSQAWIERWWEEHPKANVGVLCGHPGPAARALVVAEGRCGLAVLDVDVASGGADSLEQLAERGALTPTRRIFTGGGGGFHLYYRLDAAQVVRSTMLGPGLELRCQGAYVVGAGSRHISMTTYRLDDSSPHMLADFPVWLVAHSGS
jgi:putative DNA primase/helicase